jgi:hypothetical protein
VLVGFVAYFLLRRPGPSEVAQTAADALCARNVDTLLDLTLPEEKARLHITRESLKGVLDETIWSHTMPRQLTWPAESDSASEEVTFYAYAKPKGQSGGLTLPLAIVVTKSPDGRWRLATSNLLLHCCESSLGPEDTQGVGPLFHRLMDKYGILGVRLNSTGYQMFSDLRNPQPALEL